MAVGAAKVNRMKQLSGFVQQLDRASVEVRKEKQLSPTTVAQLQEAFEGAKVWAVKEMVRLSSMPQVQNEFYDQDGFHVADFDVARAASNVPTLADQEMEHSKPPSRAQDSRNNVYQLGRDIAARHNPHYRKP